MFYSNFGFDWNKGVGSHDNQLYCSSDTCHRNMVNYLLSCVLSTLSGYFICIYFMWHYFDFQNKTQSEIYFEKSRTNNQKKENKQLNKIIIVWKTNKTLNLKSIGTLDKKRAQLTIKCLASRIFTRVLWLDRQKLGLLLHAWGKIHFSWNFSKNISEAILIQCS